MGRNFAWRRFAPVELETRVRLNLDERCGSAPGFESRTPLEGKINTSSRADALPESSSGLSAKKGSAWTANSSVSSAAGD